MKNIQDQNDGKPWSEMDLRDLHAHLENDGTVESAAVLLCRQGTEEEVRAKARENGWIK